MMLPSASSWSGPSNNWVSKSLEPNLHHARTLAISCWAVGVVLASSTAVCPPALAVPDDSLAAPSIPTTQVKFRVETESLVRALEEKQGDLNDAVAALAQQVPSNSFRFSPVPLDSDKLQELKDVPQEPLVDVDQLVFDAWRGIFNRPRDKNEMFRESFALTLPGTTTTFDINTSAAIATVAFLSYPFTYAFYQYENDQEEKKSAAKKAALKAKKAKQTSKTTSDKPKTISTLKKGPKGATRRSAVTEPTTTTSQTSATETITEAALELEESPRPAVIEIAPAAPQAVSPLPSQKLQCCCF